MAEFVLRDRVVYLIDTKGGFVSVARDWPSHLSDDEIVVEVALSDRAKLPLTADDFARIKRKPKYVIK